MDLSRNARLLPFIAVALLFTTTPCAAASFNFGFGLGPAQMEVNDDAFNDGSLGNSTVIDEKTLTTTIYGEMAFSPYLRMEFGILDSGMAEMDATTHGSGPYWLSGPVSADYGLAAIKLGAIGVLPLGERFRLLGKVGLASWFSVVTLNEGWDDWWYDDTEVDNGISPYLGIGAEIDISKLIAVRLQHEGFSASADSDYFAAGYDFDYSDTTLGLLFRF